MEPYKYRITVFTPTYNRAYILEVLYRSIQRQAFRDFEWLIVDDGSTDHTEELIRQWTSEENDFPIRYIKQKNGGKCRAINHGLDLAQGELFFTMDSDDYLTDDALGKIDSWMKELPDDQKFCGVIANRGDSPSETPNKLFSGPFRDASILECGDEAEDPLDGERAYVFFTSIHRAYKYPEFDGENYVSPAVARNRMADAGYKMRIVNDIIWICKYLEDGLTLSGNKRFLDNPQGHGIWLRETALFFRHSLKRRLLLYYSFYCDFSAQGICSMSQSAKYIGAPLILIWGAAVLHKLRGIQKRLIKTGAPAESA